MMPTSYQPCSGIEAACAIVCCDELFDLCRCTPWLIQAGGAHICLELMMLRQRIGHPSLLLPLALELGLTEQQQFVTFGEVCALHALSKRWTLGAVLSHTPLYPLAGVVRRPQPLVRQHGVGGGDQLKRFVRAPVPAVQTATYRVAVGVKTAGIRSSTATTATQQLAVLTHRSGWCARLCLL
jgi:hypothetical protein